MSQVSTDIDLLHLLLGHWLLFGGEVSLEASKYFFVRPEVNIRCGSSDAIQLAFASGSFGEPEVH